MSINFADGSVPVNGPMTLWFNNIHEDGLPSEKLRKHLFFISFFTSSFLSRYQTIKYPWLIFHLIQLVHFYMNEPWPNTSANHTRIHLGRFLRKNKESVYQWIQNMQLALHPSMKGSVPFIEPFKDEMVMFSGIANRMVMDDRIVNLSTAFDVLEKVLSSPKMMYPARVEQFSLLEMEKILRNEFIELELTLEFTVDDVGIPVSVQPKGVSDLMTKTQLTIVDCLSETMLITYRTLYGYFQKHCATCHQLLSASGCSIPCPGCGGGAHYCSDECLDRRDVNHGPLCEFVSSQTKNGRV